MDTVKNPENDDQKMIETAEKILVTPLSHMEFYVQMFLEGFGSQPRITELVAEWMAQGKTVMDECRRIKLNGSSPN